MANCGISHDIFIFFSVTQMSDLSSDCWGITHFKATSAPGLAISHEHTADHMTGSRARLPSLHWGSVVSQILVDVSNWPSGHLRSLLVFSTPRATPSTPIKAPPHSHVLTLSPWTSLCDPRCAVWFPGLASNKHVSYQCFLMVITDLRLAIIIRSTALDQPQYWPWIGWHQYKTPI